MGALGLTGEKALRKIGSLSGGEKARVALAAFCLTPCNVLLLDEPTNHLDVESVRAGWKWRRGNEPHSSPSA
jgi:ATPase subunit of ABC transporter with duplicated ATPase domains